jgi:hypothetical protein
MAPTSTSCSALPRMTPPHEHGEIWTDEGMEVLIVATASDYVL